MQHRVSYKTITRFPGYRFGNDGSVWSAWQPAGMGHGMKIGQKWKQLKPSIRGGYLSLHLSCGNGTRRRIALHVAIAEAFIGPKPGKLIDCCHNDGNIFNCALSNLRYDTKKGNNADKRKHGTLYSGERHHDARLTAVAVADIRKAYGTVPVSQMASQYGVSVRAVWGAILRETWKHIP